MDREGFRNRMKQYKLAREENPGLKYYDFMERLAEFKAKQWGEDEDVTLMDLLNANDYNYRLMYEDDPNYKIDSGHFDDEYKTVWHPTFSEESRYSGKQSEYNPEGVVGGSWDMENKRFYLNDRRLSKQKAQDYLNYNDPGYQAIPKYDGGGEVGKSDLSWWEKLKAGASTILMNLSHQLALGGDFTNLFSPTNVAQDSYLVDRNVLQKMFEEQGYTKVDKDDYGLVRKAVGNRNIPIFQRKKDSKKREDLTVLENLPNIWYGAQDAELDHAGSYPSAVYVDKNGYLYQKAWDLNDYGEHSAGTGGFTYGSKQWFANTLDKIGSPTVVTTGFQPIINDKHEKLPVNAFNIKKKKFKHTGEVYEDAPDGLLSLLDYAFLKKGLRRIDLGDSYTYGLPEVKVTPKKYDEGGEVTGPPTESQWRKSSIKDQLWMHPDFYMAHSLTASKNALKLASAELYKRNPNANYSIENLIKNDPGWEYYRDEVWANENPNKTGYDIKTGRWYPHKSPEGGARTIGPGFKLNGSKNNPSSREAYKGMTIDRLNQYLRKHYYDDTDYINDWINVGDTINASDTISPQIKMGLLDLTHQVGPTNMKSFNDLRSAVKEGDVDKIRKESTVTWKDKYGNINVDNRRKKLRNEKYFHYAEGGQVDPNPLDVLEASRPKVAGIPINDPPIENVFSPLDIMLGTAYKLSPLVNNILPNYGPTLGALILGSDNKPSRTQPLVTKKLDPDVNEFYKDVVIPMNPNDEVYKHYFMKQFGNPDIEIHPMDNLPDGFAADFNPNTNLIRIGDKYALSPNYQQFETHEYGHLLDKYLPHNDVTKQKLNEALPVSKTPISKDSDTYRERQSTKREAEFKAFKKLKESGKMKVKTAKAKTKRYQEYLANATDEEILELLGADTAYKKDYLNGSIDIDTLRKQMMYAPTIAAGLMIPTHLLEDDTEWT